MDTLMSSLYIKYHDNILHKKLILAMITIYTADGTTPPHTNTRPRRSVQNTNSPLSQPKFDTSITPTIMTLSALDTWSSHPTNIDTDATLSITIWNQLMSQYQIPFWPNTRNWSRHPSTAVQYTLIDIYNKILNPPKLPCLLLFFTRIICVVLSCFILLADSFTMVKIDDQCPDKWND